MAKSLTWGWIPFRCRIAPKQQKVQLLDMPSTQGCTFWSPTTSRWRCKTFSQSFNRWSVWYLGALLHCTVHFLGMWCVPFFGGVPWMPATKNNDFFGYFRVYFPYSFAAISSSSALRCTPVPPDDAKVRHNSSQRLDVRFEAVGLSVCLRPWSMKKRYKTIKNVLYPWTCSGL